MAENPHVHSAVFLKSAVLLKDYPEVNGLPEVAVVGRSNVGKSSLINGLANRNAWQRCPIRRVGRNY